MKSVMRRDIKKEIEKSFNRFLSILTIVALGVGFIAGIKAVAPSMKYTADLYFDNQNFMDLRLISTVGFTEQDIAEIRITEGINKIQASYMSDVLIDSIYGLKTVRFHAMPEMNDFGMNRPVLLEGRWPEKSGECVMDHKQAGVLGLIGSKIIISDPNNADKPDMLVPSEFVITGYVKSPEYIDYSTRGAINISNNSLYSFFYVSVNDFKSDYYSDVLISVEGSKVLQCYSNAYDDLIAKTSVKLQTIARVREDIRYEEIKKSAYTKLAESEQLLKDEIIKADAELADAKLIIDDGISKLKESEDKINRLNKDFSDATADLTKQKNDYNSEVTAIQAGIKTAEDKILLQQKSLDERLASNNQRYILLDELTAQIQTLKNSGKNEDAVSLELQAADISNVLKAEDDVIIETYKNLFSAKQEVNAIKDQLETKKISAEAVFTESQKKIDEAGNIILKARNEIELAKKNLEKAQSDYSAASEEIKEKQKTAENNISDLKDSIDKSMKPEWFVLTRKDNRDFVNFGTDSKRINALTDVFPVFFYIIAALVCLTTITRMVEEQRTQIGIFLSIGVSKGAVASKYLIYAGIASILGCVFGLIAGYLTLPYAIYRTYETSYTVIPLEVVFNAPLAFLYSLIAVLVVILAALFACYYEITAVPAELIRPKAPLPGSRVLLERIPFIWNHLSFLLKVTFRNIFRYKKRLFMTIMGISGCTALLLTGFGVRDSISDTVPLQFYGLHSYHLFINLISPGNSGELNELNNALKNSLEDSLYVTQIELNVEGLDSATATYLFVPEDTKKAIDFVNFHERKTGIVLKYPMTGKVIITEKIASMLNLKLGSIIKFKKEDSEFVSSIVGGITENYVYNYIYMSPEDYSSTFNSEPDYKFILGKIPDIDNLKEQTEKEISDLLADQENVKTVTMISSIRSEFDNAMKNLDAMVFIIILCACLLAFVVLYNLMNINITERIREIATIKVLGLFNLEVSAYIYREIIILTLFGAFIGIIGGIFLHRFTIETAEVGILMYVRNIKPISYIYSVALTVIFSAIVNLILQFRLNRINMAESLKSTD